MVTLILPKTDIVRIQAHFGKPTPVLFIFASPSCCERVRTCLKMTKESRIWFDISVEDMAMRHITVLLEKVSEDCKDMLQRLYGDIIEKVDEKQANEILIKSAPKPQQDQRQQINSTVRFTENQVFKIKTFFISSFSWCLFVILVIVVPIKWLLVSSVCRAYSFILYSC